MLQAESLFNTIVNVYFKRCIIMNQHNETYFTGGL